MTKMITIQHLQGAYENSVYTLIQKLSHRSIQDQVAADILKVLLHISSEHTLGLVIRTIRKRPAPTPLDPHPSEDAIQEAIKALETRKNGSDLAAAKVLALLTDLVCEATLETIVNSFGLKSVRRLAA